MVWKPFAWGPQWVGSLGQFPAWLPAQRLLPLGPDLTLNPGPNPTLHPNLTLHPSPCTQPQPMLSPGLCSVPVHRAYLSNLSTQLSQ